MQNRTLNLRIYELENMVIALRRKLDDVSRNTEEKSKNPISIVGGATEKSIVSPIDLRSGRCMHGSAVTWNNTEVDNEYGVEPVTPEVGYNKHSHDRFSGGALIKGIIEIVEYVWGAIVNKHSQQYWNPQPEIATEVNSDGETVEKIGQLELVFNPDTKTWGTPAYEIDVKKCYLVERDADGNIAIDENGNEKKSPLYNEDSTKSAIVWDKNSRCFRFYATYAPGE